MQAWRQALGQPFGSANPVLPEPSADGYPLLRIFPKAWSLFLGLAWQDRVKLMAVYFLLAIAAFLKERTYVGGSWQDVWAWFIHLAVSTWALSFFLFSPTHRNRWWLGLPSVIVFLFLLDILSQIFWSLNLYFAAFSGLMVAWVLPKVSIPLLLGALSPDFLILILPLFLFLLLGLVLVWFLLGLTFVIPLILDRGVGVGPAVVSSFQAIRGSRRQLLMLFVLVAALVSLPILLMNVGKVLVSFLPFTMFGLIPPSPLGVWICFGVQTLILSFGTLLAVWIWPLGSALWAALYLERWNAGRPASH
jgi:hypothetical protein